MPPSDTSIEVTLRSLDGLDDFPERRFILSPSTTMPVGRSSKNASKKLMSGADNAFIDSPVISRGHALLSASNALGIPTVFITDNGSMHGTFVNSHPLTRLEGHRLHNGDTLQFGQNVVRDQDSFIAKKYRFISQAAPAISRGFSVPEMDTEEEEIEEIEEQKALRTARYGSQANPVNLDDFEDNPQQVVDLEDDVAGSPKVSEPALARHESPPPVARKLFTEVLANKDNPASQLTAPVPAPQFLFNEGGISDDDEHVDAYERTEQGQIDTFDFDSDSVASAEEEVGEGSDSNLDVDSEEDNVSNLSQAGSLSETESESESDEPEPNPDTDTDTIPLIRLGALLNLRKAPSIEKPTYGTYNPYTAQDTSKYQEPLQKKPTLDVNSTVSPREAECVTGVPSNNGFGFPAWDDMAFTPADSKISMWCGANAFSGEHSSDNGQWFEPTPATTFTHTSPSEFRPTRSDYLGQVLNTEPAPTPAMSIPTPPMPTCDKANPMNNQSTRRTKVSIPEIVEETTQQPPTPTSVDSPKNLKRKAEALGEDEVEAREAPQSPAVEGTVAGLANVAQTAAEEPLAKRRRTTFATVAANAASFIAGGAFAVGALLMLPETVYS